MSKKEDKIDPLAALIMGIVLIVFFLFYGLNSLLGDANLAWTLAILIFILTVFILAYLFRYQIKQHLGLAAKSYGLGSMVNDKTQIQQSSHELEAQLQFKIANNLNKIEAGLELIGIEYPTNVGRIDILALDRNGLYVVIELKKGMAGDKTVGQVTRYMGVISEQFNQRPRGMIIARDFNEQLRASAKMIPDLKLVRYDQIKL